MKAEDMLCEYLKIKRDIKRLEVKKEEYKIIAESCTVDPTQEKVQTSKNPDPMGSAVVEMVSINEKIEEKQKLAKAYLELLDQCLSEIEKEKEWQLLILRYFKGATWSEIADTIGVNNRYVYVLHKNALNDLQEIIDEKNLKNIS